jgi:hypothetical protein
MFKPVHKKFREPSENTEEEVKGPGVELMNYNFMSRDTD